MGEKYAQSLFKFHYVYRPSQSLLCIYTNDIEIRLKTFFILLITLKVFAAHENSTPASKIHHPLSVSCVHV